MYRADEVTRERRAPVEGRRASPFELGVREFRAEAEVGAEPAYFRITLTTVPIMGYLFAGSITKYIITVTVC